MIKPIFCTDITNDKNNENINGDEFITATVSEALKQSLESSAEKVLGYVEKAKLPLPLRIIGWVSGASAFLTAASIFGSEVSLSEGYSNAPYLFWIAPICFVIWLVLFIASKLKAKQVLDTDDSSLATDQLNSVSSLISDELGVPKGSPEVDLIAFAYKIKDGKIVIKGEGLEAASCQNLIFNIFKRDGVLNFANLEHRYSIDVSTLKRITRVKKRIRFLSWNKDVEPNKGIYKQFKLTTDQFGNIHMKEYYVLEFDKGTDTFGICFPSYELHVIESITGLKAE